MEDITNFKQEENNNLLLTLLATFLGMAILIAIAWFLKIPNHYDIVLNLAKTHVFYQPYASNDFF